MAEFHDFELSGDRSALPPSAPSPEGTSPPAAQEAATPPLPVSVAAPSRGRLSSLAAPAVILVAAVAILSLRPPEPTWTATAPSSKAATESPTTYPLVVRVAPVSPNEANPTPIIEASPDSSGGTAGAEPPLELLSAADARPPEAAPAEVKPLSPEKQPVAAAPSPEQAPAPVAAPAPVEPVKPFTVAVPHDPIQTRLAMASIAAEARRKQEDAAQTAAMRNSIQELERHRVAEQIVSERESADRRRAEFRRELTAILERDGDRAAPAIWGLVQARHVEPSPTIERAIAETIRSRKGQLGRIARVEIFREHGLDESLIFAELYREQVGMMSMRRGPRTREDAVVRAARALLAIDPEPLTAVRAAPRP